MKNFVNVLKAKYQQYKGVALAVFATVASLGASLPAHASGLSTLISDAGTQFSTTTGFAYADLVSWAGNILTQILGGGLGLIDALIGWIIAIIIITVIIRLIFHGLRWLHVLR